MSQAPATNTKAAQYDEYVKIIDADQNLTAEEKAAKKKEARDAIYAAPSFNIDEFSDLLGRLEGSKMRQQRQKSVEGRRDIFAGGLAGMMSNF